MPQAHHQQQQHHAHVIRPVARYEAERQLGTKLGASLRIDVKQMEISIDFQRCP